MAGKCRNMHDTDLHLLAEKYLFQRLFYPTYKIILRINKRYDLLMSVRKWTAKYKIWMMYTQCRLLKMSTNF